MKQCIYVLLKRLGYNSDIDADVESPLYVDNKKLFNIDA